MADLRPLFTWRGAIASAESELSSTQRLVALVLSLHMNERGGSCFPSIDTLAEETGLSDRAVQRSLRELRDAGWIALEKKGGTGPGTPNRYQAVVPERVTEVHPSPDKGDTEGSIRVNLTTEKGDTRSPEDVLQDVSLRGRTCTNGSADRAPAVWPENLEGIKQLLTKVNAPLDLFDVGFWERVDELTEGTEVYYDDQLRAYLAWLESKPPTRRHKNHRRGFLSWIREEISRDGRRQEARRASTRR